MVDIPWPISSNPGLKPQEGTGRLINVFAEPRGDGTPVWRRVPGATVFAREPSSGSAQLEFNAVARGETYYSTFFQLVGSSTTQIGTTGAVTHTFSGEQQTGDLIFLAYGADGIGNVPTTPTDWTALGTTVSFMGIALMYKVSTGEASVELSGGDVPGVVLSWSIRGAMSTAPIVDTATISTGASLDPVPPNFTATTADCLMVNVSWQDNDNASAVVAPTTITIGGGSTFGIGGNLFAVSTGVSGTNGATVMVGLRPLVTTGAITASSWAVTGGDDEWASLSFTIRHD